MMITNLRSRLLAAVRRTAAQSQIAAVCRPALDLVWAFLRTHPGLRTHGRNVFLYHHVDRPGAGMPIDFGVEVRRPFEPDGCYQVPAAAGASITMQPASLWKETLSA